MVLRAAQLAGVPRRDVSGDADEARAYGGML